MNADAFRHFYNYHISENRKLWNEYIALLSQEQFLAVDKYSKGSIRNQVVHMIEVDDTWFKGLQGSNDQSGIELDGMDDRKILRTCWDNVEQNMRAFLEKLQDNMLFNKPFEEGEDKDLILWQVLLQVVNHGTDHRAQILRSLNNLGYKTVSQDYIFYTYENPWKTV
ncbi:MAG: DinB family protein [Chloroflexota bacterium]